MEDILPELYNLVCRELWPVECVMLALVCKTFYKRAREHLLPKKDVGWTLLLREQFRLFVWWTASHGRDREAETVTHFARGASNDAIRRFLQTPGNPFSSADVCVPVVERLATDIVLQFSFNKPLPTAAIEDAFSALGCGGLSLRDIIYGAYRLSDGRTFGSIVLEKSQGRHDLNRHHIGKAASSSSSSSSSDSKDSD